MFVCEPCFIFIHRQSFFRSFPDFSALLLKLHSPAKKSNVKNQDTCMDLSYISNLDASALIKHLLLHRRE